MKNIFKRLTITICAVTASAMLAAAPVLATSEGFRSGPDDTAAVTDTTNTVAADSSAGEQQTAATATTAGTVANVNTVTTDNSTNSVTSQASNARANKKYLSKVGGFLWFLLSVIVNFVVSYWLGSRFYRMARKSAQGSSEIRALRKDIEEKFASTLKDVEEPAIDVINRNENYARDDEGLSMPERHSHVELDADELEMVRRWDSRRAAAKSGREDDYEAEMSRERRTSYQPTRKSSGIEFDDDYEDDDEREEPVRQSGREKQNSKFSNAKNRTKDFLSNVFPFDE